MKSVVGACEVLDRGSETLGTTQRGGAGYTMTQQTVSLEIEGQIVTIKSRDPFPVKTGDIVAAAGNTKRGILSARGAVNVTRSISVRT